MAASSSRWMWSGVAAALFLAAPAAALATDAAALTPATAGPATNSAAQPASAPSDAAAIADLVAREAQDEKQLQAQQALIQQQAAELARTKALLEEQQGDLNSLKLATNDLLAARGAGGPGAAGGIQEIAANTQGPPGGEPVGQAPPTHPNQALALPLPQGIDVLTPAHHLVFDNALEYQNSSSNRVVFQGIQLINAIQIGVLEANQTTNDSGFYYTTLRYGLLPRLDAEIVVPWIERADKVTTVVTATPPANLTQTFNIRGGGIGDVEGTVRYQFNEGRNGWPIFVGGLRVVSNSGRGPFDVQYNSLGVAQKLPTGSGFWQINPTFLALYPLDPVVFFGSIGYQHGFGRNIDKFFGTGQSLVHVGKSYPGDSFTAAVGFAFSINSRFSYSLGYKHAYFEPSTNYFLPTMNLLHTFKSRTQAVNDGTLLAGASYRVNDHASLNLNFEFGVTADAPNDTVIFRVPYLF